MSGRSRFAVYATPTESTYTCTAIGSAVSGSNAHPDTFSEFGAVDTASTLPMGARPESVIVGCAPGTTTVLQLSTVVEPSPVFMP